MTNETKHTAVEQFANEVYQIIENYGIDKMVHHIEKAHQLTRSNKISRNL
jgi:hypothetical protein